MAITTYAELVTAITTSWMHRSDLAAVAPEFIALAESKINRKLRSRHQELALAETAIDASYQVAIPSTALAVKRMWRTDEPKTPLNAAPLEFIIGRQYAGGLALNYCGEDAKWRFDGTGNVAGVLYRSIPGLSSSNTTNWLLTLAPDLYLYACLAEACSYTSAAEKSVLWETKAEARIEELNRTEHRDTFSGAIRTRVSGVV